MIPVHTPFFDGLTLHDHNSPRSLHVPGHKNGRILPEIGRDYFGKIALIDQTELTGLDDLHEPEGIIQEAETMLAALYGAKASFFLVGGSTSGNLAMMHTVSQHGGRVLVQRNSHQSVFHALELFDIDPVYIEPESDPGTGLSLGVNPLELSSALRTENGISAVFLTNPTYEGYGQPLEEHVRIAHEAGAVVCVDEAHGAHLIPGASFGPESAVAAGADAVVQSAHKSLPALTMGAWLHVNGDSAMQEDIRRSLKMLQSSSPSYPLLASLDLARAFAASFEAGDWASLLSDCQHTHARLRDQGCPLAPDTIGVYTRDPVKLPFIAGAGDDPAFWARQLEAAGWFPEMATANHLLAVLPIQGPFTEEEQALAAVVKSGQVPKSRGPATESPAVSAPAERFSALRHKPAERTSWTKAAGKTAAETIIPYPPGIPLVIKGERITEKHLEAFRQGNEPENRCQRGLASYASGVLTIAEKGAE
ncbi:aminotransferase class I/II-fold pyridoxal phosphate-dependent enzyme [Salisediminibacterium halotolerans]|uniref:Arginine/lysine/ornithine decarboxylase n=1 Tax=Salisediminibacterium halotolerans TaxID=517425 RepID=A0A1H9VQY8_9BACI|nr:aminotransferase class I/II-fold pyridoxal phosphate-dependent enzyme [Salisediminibacterium haloalkalitolerans]SES23941.1 Arginine/lysine/ornithine decarboxylase [Salisediminibacterium haloalkalitolerans]